MKINKPEGGYLYQEENNATPCRDGSLFQASLQVSIATKESERIEADAQTKAPDSIAKVTRVPEGFQSYSAQRASIEGRAAQRTEVRFLAYAQADKVRVDVLNGYALKGKLLVEEGKEPVGVYVEAKHDDGYVEAYTVDIRRIRQDTIDPVEQLALDILQQAEERK